MVSQWLLKFEPFRYMAWYFIPFYFVNPLTDCYRYTYFYCFYISYFSYSHGLPFLLKEYPLKFSYRVGLVVMNFFNLLFVWEAIYPFILNDSLARFLKKNFFLHLFIFDRERQSTSGGGAEREGDRESKAGSRLRAVSTEPDAGLEPTNCEIVTWAKVRRLTNLATQVPLALPDS